MRNVNMVLRIPQIYELISIKRLLGHLDLLQYLRHHRWLDDDKGFLCQKHYHGYKNTWKVRWIKEGLLKLIFSFFFLLNVETRFPYGEKQKELKGLKFTVSYVAGGEIFLR